MDLNKDFPRGCIVEVIDNVAKKIGVPSKSKAVVVGHCGSSYINRRLMIEWLPPLKKSTNDYNPEFFQICFKTDKKRPTDPMFCSCEVPKTVKNSIFGQVFLYCRKCCKERL